MRLELKLPDSSSLVPILLITAFLSSSSAHCFFSLSFFLSLSLVVWQGRNIFKSYFLSFLFSSTEKTWAKHGETPAPFYPYRSKCLWISEQVIINAFERAYHVFDRNNQAQTLEFSIRAACQGQLHEPACFVVRSIHQAKPWILQHLTALLCYRVDDLMFLTCF